MHSMTGFGRAEHATSTIAARIEASSVNRKQGEIVVQLPRAYAELEAGIRKIALQKLSRGRVSISIQLERPEGATSTIGINADRARALEAAFTKLSDAIDRTVQATSADFLRTPEILAFDDDPADPGAQPRRTADATDAERSVCRHHECRLVEEWRAEHTALGHDQTEGRADVRFR